jgi:hypothetical protein
MIKVNKQRRMYIWEGKKEWKTLARRKKKIERGANSTSLLNPSKWRTLTFLHFSVPGPGKFDHPWRIDKNIESNYKASNRNSWCPIWPLSNPRFMSWNVDVLRKRKQKKSQYCSVFEIALLAESFETVFESLIASCTILKRAPCAPYFHLDPLKPLSWKPQFLIYEELVLLFKRGIWIL